MHIAAHELETKGVSVIENKLDEYDELTITVGDKANYVVIGMERYNYLRECELEANLQQTE